ncbi:MAG: DNA translocase FtsK 4TM domain-containing protein [Bacteroidota bacterium]
MAENVLRKKPVKEEKEEKKADFRLNWNGSFINDRRWQLVFGITLMFLSFYLFTAFLSHYFTREADQDLVENFFGGPLRETGRETENWAGLTAAVLSEFFVFKLFGLSAFFIPPILFLLGAKILVRKELIPMQRLVYFSVLAGLWFSTFLGYFIYLFDLVGPLGSVCGGIGLELATFLSEMTGWGTFLVLVLYFVLFLVFFFDMQDFFYNLFSPAIPAALKADAAAAVVSASESDDTDEGFEEIIPDSPISNKNKTKGPVPFSFTAPSAQEVQQEIPFVAPQQVSKGPDLVIEPTIVPVGPPINIPAPTAPVFDITAPPEEKTASKTENYDPTLDLGRYVYPTLDLMEDHGPVQVQINTEELQGNKDKIVETLSHYGIGIASIKATVGPTVTLYEIVPDAGIRIAKIKNLEDDIALSLAALGIRIIAPIPGKGTIGIEVPNKNREMVGMRSVLATEKFMKSTMDLPVVLGKTISNEVFVVDLAKMPHLLMAGATGQGKSVGLNVLLTSLIYRKHPSQLKFVLVDPKKVELSVYSTIERHFLAKLPNTDEAIITDTKKVIHTLNSLCIEMDIRYDLLKEAGCRNLKEYNLKFVERRLNPENGHRFLPYIVLVIDELADLMMTAGKEVETPIARLAQLARAIGIHLVVATQRPSVNVITGIIKANFPARLSFRVTSKVDSRTILDTGGAEQLVGQGDMLLSMGSEIIRLQCAFVDTPDVERICNFVGNQRGYDTAYNLPEFEGEDGGGNGKEPSAGELDSMFAQAAEVIVTHQMGSTTLLQRKLKLGFGRAARIVDQMESLGIVGPASGTKTRPVLMDMESLELKLREIGLK